MRSFDEILKEFENFFSLQDSKKNESSGKLKARDVYLDLEIDFLGLDLDRDLDLDFLLLLCFFLSDLDLDRDLLCFFSKNS